jgi:hypothetical protein
MKDFSDRPQFRWSRQRQNPTAPLRVIELEKETPLAGQAYLALAGIHRKQDKTEQAARDTQEYRRIQALTARVRE